MANPHERHAMAAVVAHLTAAAAAGGPPAAADLGSAADALSRAYGLGSEPPAAADAPSFLAVWEAGAAALGVAPTIATASGGGTPRSAGVAAPASTPAASTPTFEKFLRTLKKTKFFDGVAEGSPEYDARVATARAKFESKYGAGTASGVATGVAAGVAAGAAAAGAAVAGAAAGAPPADTPAPAAANTDASAAEDSVNGGGSTPTDADIAAAEELKAQGNDALLRKDYVEAERLYTAALSRRPGTAVYLSNRAAAKIYQASYVDALDDCKAAIEAEPGFVRAHERLASAYRHLGMVDEEVAALQDAATLDPASTKIATALASARARSSGEASAGNSSVGSRSAPPPSAGGSRGAGGGGPGLPPGLPPGLEGLLNNPALRSMAENFANSGGLQSMMNNPAAMANMMSALGGMGGAGGAGGGGADAPPAAASRGPGAGGGGGAAAGGGMPDLSALLSNPALASMLGNLGGAGGAPGGGGGGGGGGGAQPNPMAAIQQAMSDPEQMAQLMNMAQSFLGGGRGGGAGGAPPR
ncbi:hypothetical protein MMPV_001278 [Pyropia vietnamensis]